MAISQDAIDAKYIEDHLTKAKKVYQGRWLIGFVAGDGYFYNAEEDGNLRQVKPHLKDIVIKLALAGRDKHPIYPQAAEK